ncbi:MAG TPA: hypothetical protein VIL46_09890 [Gemmataceae bacterium]
MARPLPPLATLLVRGRGERATFWAPQVVRLFTAVLLVGVVSIWFDDPTRLATAPGLSTAGPAFALRSW